MNANNTTLNRRFSVAPMMECSVCRRISRFFNLFYSEAGGQVTHSLSTNIIAPDGHVYRSYYDNDWKPADVLSDLTKAVANAPQERTAISSRHGSS